MDKYIRYHKYKNYICIIELINNNSSTYDNSSIDNFSNRIDIYNATYRTDKCKIKHIIDMVTNDYIDKINDTYYVNSIIHNVRKVNIYDINVDMPNIIYFLSFDKCFYHNFIEEKQYLLWISGFCGTYNMYNDYGEYIKTLFINNNFVIRSDSYDSSDSSDSSNSFNFLLKSQADKG
jgi:hypothetical protein